MKKLFTLLMALILTINVGFSQSQGDNGVTIQETPTVMSVDSATLSETERIVDKYTDKVASGFNNLLEKTTPYAEEGFNMVVKLQKAKAFAKLMILFMGTIFLIWFMRVFPKADYSEYDWNRWATLSVLIGILGLTCFIIGLFNLYDAVLLFLAPEWYAVKEIMSLFK